ncbi:unnamed protein product [Alopecurus aequalis]
MANYHGGSGRYGMATAWREPDSPQLSLMSGCSSLFSISALRNDDGERLLTGSGSWSLPGTPVSFGGIACGDEVDMEFRQGGSGGDDRKTVRMMWNRESALRSRAKKRAYAEELEKEVQRLVDENLKLKKQCKELKQEVTALVLPTKSSLRRTSSAEF